MSFRNASPHVAHPRVAAAPGGRVSGCGNFAVTRVPVWGLCGSSLLVNRLFVPAVAESFEVPLHVGSSPRSDVLLDTAVVMDVPVQ